MRERWIGRVAIEQPEGTEVARGRLEVLAPMRAARVVPP